MAQQPSHQTVRLERGRHSSPADGVCVMELASMLAGEPFTDRPRGVCPVIAAFLRTYNDAVPGEINDLYEYAARAVGTRGSRALVQERKRMCLDAAVRPARAGRVRPLLTSAAAAGRAAAFSFVEHHGHRHGAALAFADALIERQVPERPVLEDSPELREWAANLARLDSR